MRFSSLVSPSHSFRASLYAGVVLLVLQLCSAVDAADLTEAGEAVLQGVCDISFQAMKFAFLELVFGRVWQEMRYRFDA
jgi:hypothetical protein